MEYLVQVIDLVLSFLQFALAVLSFFFVLRGTARLESAGEAPEFPEPAYARSLFSINPDGFLVVAIKPEPMPIMYVSNRRLSAYLSPAPENAELPKMGSVQMTYRQLPFVDPPYQIGATINPDGSTRITFQIKVSAYH